ncbi:hypothetical protein FJV41_28765 [Myxococcus llanfairpwllgwyngyllgogerychwyrndrobwllllantysiliogogogochensis]|uniref:Uncharacterized protein n=1 Tax=Myxococcus llanfairpwllgwyngyllgogerychwyrndrobwllllantysiliogogogochensis TaxID=2590453 RepID=A0A540WTW7_9BACT|nr:hypothetical protein [Myxococcus llanfairpwllgwyngyllgogerychwyrndrobwllllantysiliogogogochensis]TQF12479.1 hypothetical protein FJV41_28765 [Myxococcus llanfairpwllgwyngyllgogerychwyrndrobwllllantysiliogogogochensis]
MSVIPAHVGSLSIAGEPEEFVNAEAVPAPGFTGTEYRITDPARRRLSPGVPSFVEVSPDGDMDAAAWVPAEAIVDPLFGFVYLTTAPGPSALVRVSGASLPVQPVALVRSLSLSVTNDVVELQVMGDGYKRRAVSLRDFSGELVGLTALDVRFEDEAPLLVEVSKGAGSEVFRAWVKVPELAHKLTPGALYEHTVKFIGHAYPTGSGAAIAWGYGTP